MQPSESNLSKAPALIKLKLKQLSGDNRPVTANARVAVPNSESEEQVVVPQQKFKPQDPRFQKSDDYQGAAFINSYKFVTEIRKKELEQLSKSVGETKDQQVIKNLQQIKQKINAAEARLFENKVKQELKKAERDAVKEGKQVFHLTNRQTKDVVKAARFVEKTKKGANRFIEKQYERQDQRRVKGRK